MSFLENLGKLAAQAAAKMAHNVRHSGVFINGMELNAFQAANLRQLMPMLPPGRYALDPMGNLGFEGGPPLVNLHALQQQTAAMQARGGAWSHHNSNLGHSVGGDGEGFMYYMDKDTSYTSG